VTAALAGFRVQLWRLRGNFDDLQTFAIAPLFALIFCGIVASSDRDDLLGEATIGAALVSVWVLCAQIGSNVVQKERRLGMLETLVSTPGELRWLFLGRISAFVSLSVLFFPEVWLTTAIFFRHPVSIPHPGVLLLTVVLLLVGLVAAASLVAGLAMLVREAQILQNALTYPLYLLGGLLVPASYLPDWLRPFSRLVFLSWASDLARASLRSGPIANLGTSVLGLLITSLLMMIGSQLLLGAVIKRARTRGLLGLS